MAFQKSSLQRIAVSATIAVAVLFHLYSLDFYPSSDEGFYLTIAEGLWEGNLPYRDYFLMQLPGLPVLLSLLLPITENIIHLRLFILLINIGTAAVLYKTATRLEFSVPSIAPALYLFGLLALQGTFILTEPVAAFWISLGLLLYITGLFQQPSTSLRYLCGTGIAIGVGTLFKQPVALIGIGFALHYLWYSFRDRHQLGMGLVSLASGAAVPAVVLIGALFGTGIWEEFLSDAVFAPLRFGRISSTTPEELLEMVLYLPAILLLPLVYLPYRSLSRQSLPDEDWVLIILLPLAAYSLTTNAFGHYWILCLPIATLIATRMIDQVNQIDSKTKQAGFLAGILVLTMITGFGVVMNSSKPLTGDKPLTADANQIESEVEAHSDPGDQILILGIQPVYYYLTDTEPLTRNLWHIETNVGYTYTDSELATDVVEQQPPVVILSNKWCGSIHTNTCEYVTEHYSEGSTFNGGTYTVYTNTSEST